MKGENKVLVKNLESVKVLNEKRVSKALYIFNAVFLF